MSGSPPDTTASTAKPATRRKPTSSSPPRSRCLGKQSSREASLRAATILEVLGGLRMPSEAAAALGISVTHYYLLERKALAGLLAACEPQPKGSRGPSFEKKLAVLQRELEACRHECMRQAALVRATQRAVGLPAAPSSAKKDSKAGSKKKRPRRPTVRALRAAATVRNNSSGENPPHALEKRPPREVTGETTARTIEKERYGDAPG
jgi:hypothetical protein